MTTDHEPSPSSPTTPRAGPLTARRAVDTPARTWMPAAVTLLAVVVAVAVVVVVVAVVGAGPYAALETSDPGPVVRLATPLVRLVADVAAVLTVGPLAFALCCTGSPTSDHADPGTNIRRAAIRSSGRWAIVSCLAALVLVVLSAADQTGRPLLADGPARVLGPTSEFALWTAAEEPIGWLVVAAVTLLVVVGCCVARRRGAMAVLVTMAVVALLPPVATGHAASNAGHDLATAALMVHVPAAVVWTGVLVAVLRRRPDGTSAPPEVMRRCAGLTAVCQVVVAASGVAVAAVLAPPGSLSTTAYGRSVLVTVGLLTVVGLVGAARRRRLRGALGTGPVALPTATRTFRRWAGGEVVLLAATLGVSVAGAHLAPPSWVGRASTPNETMLGYDLAGPPTFWRLIGDWRLDLVFAPVCLVLSSGYAVAVVHLRRSGRAWPAGRTTAWMCGCAVLLLATSSGVGRYGAAMFSVHIAADMLATMLAPLLLALGGPITLVRRTLSVRPSIETPGLPGPREWLPDVRGSVPLRWATHPALTSVLVVAAPFALYFTGLFDAAVRFHWAHLGITGCLLVLGYLFAWSTVGVDPTPRPWPTWGRAATLLAVMPAQAGFAVALATTTGVIGNGPGAAQYYQALALPWVPALLADQHLAAGIALGLGELTSTIALAALLIRSRPIG